MEVRLFLKKMSKEDGDNRKNSVGGLWLETI